MSTKQALANSLMKLLKQQTLDHITVSDITDDCGVNRQTFYYHFHDVYDLLQWMLKSQYEQNLAKREPAFEDWKTLTKDVYRNLLEQKAFYLNVYHSLPNYFLRNFLKDISKP